MTQSQIEMIKEVRGEMTAIELAEYVSNFTGESSAPEHDKYLVSAALLGDKTAMFLCHMA